MVTVMPWMLREKRDVDGSNGDERVEQPRPQHRNNSQREQDVGKAHQGIDAAHDDIVGKAAEVSGDDAHGCADHCGDHGGGEANQQRQPRPPQQPAEQVTPEVIRAEQGTFGKRQPEAAGRIDHVRVGQRQQGGDQRQHDQRHKHHQPDQCQPVARDQPDQPDHVLILGVEQGLQHVDDDVEQHVAAGDKDHAALHQHDVALEDASTSMRPTPGHWNTISI